MKSIRAYLIVVILSVICLSNFLAALHGYRNSMQSAEQLVDRQILEKTHTISRLVERLTVLPESLYDENSLFQVWIDGELLARSGNAPGYLFVDFEDGFHTVSYDGKRWRTYRRSDEGGDSLVIVAQRFDVYNALTESVLLEAIYPIIWILPIVGLLVWLIVHLGLKPLRQLAGRLSRQRVDDFSTLDRQRYPGEMLPIVDSLNAFFQRLNQAFDRERRFSADAAHELRTPLAAMKVGLHNISTGEADRTELDRMNHMVERMGHTIEQLLVMHRVAAEHSQANSSECDLAHIVQTVIAELYAAIEAKQQNIELIGDEGVIHGDAFSLSVLFRNLIDNASKYSPQAGTIRVTIADHGSQVEVVVEDSGEGIPESEYQRVLERFYRVGGDRHASGVSGSGLGLSIVSHVAHSHGVQLSLSKSSDLGGLAVRLSFPASRGSTS